MNMRGNGPVLKSDTVCDLHMLNEAKIYISGVLIPAEVAQFQPQFKDYMPTKSHFLV